MLAPTSYLLVILRDCVGEEDDKRGSKYFWWRKGDNGLCGNPNQALRALGSDEHSIPIF